MKILAYSLSIILAASGAFACDLNKFPFGQNQEQVRNQYGIMPMPLMQNNTEMLAEHGKVICDKWPEDSLVEFHFIDNNLTNINIGNVSANIAIFDLAQKAFGENDDKDRKSAKIKNKRVAIWSKDKSYVAIYASAPSGNLIEERLSIASKKHQPLIDKDNLKKGLALDKYMKENKLGKYKSSTSTSNGTSSGNYKAPADLRGSTGNYDANALRNLEKEYKQRNKEWKGQ